MLRTHLRETSSGTSISRLDGENGLEPGKTQLAIGQRPLQASDVRRTQQTPAGTSGVAYLLQSIGRGGKNVAKWGALAAAGVGFALAQAPAPAFADYVRPAANGTIEIVRSPISAPVLPASVASENAGRVAALDRGAPMSEAELSEFPLFKKLWVELSDNGVWEIAPDHVSKLLDYAAGHNLHGNPIPRIPVIGDGPTTISEGHRALIKHLLEHPYYGGFFEQEARPMLQAAFGLPVETVRSQPDLRPVDAGDVDLASLPAWRADNYQGTMVADLHTSLVREYQHNRGWYEGGSNEQSAARLTALLMHFGRAIHMHDQVDSTALAMDRVSEAFHDLPVFSGSGDKARFLVDYFAKDFNGTGLGLAESIIRGFDPNRIALAFPGANTKTNSVTYLSMSGSLLKESLSLIDEYRVKSGMEPQAVWRAGLSVHNSIIGLPRGNDKTSLDERSPFASRVNFGIALEFGSPSGGFARASEIEKLTPKPGFEFPIDVVTANGYAVPAAGADLQVFLQKPDGRAGERLSVEKVIHDDASGNPQHWSAIFRDSAGNVVPPEKVIGRFARGGGFLGDGLANQQLDTGFWGFCDLNTAQQVNGAIQQFPALDVAGTIYIPAGDGVLAVPKERAQEIIDMSFADMAPDTKFAGYRHDRNIDLVRFLRDGLVVTERGSLTGVEKDPRHHPKSALRWHEGDILEIDLERSSSRPLGVVRMETTNGASSIEAAQINRIIRLGGDQVQVVYNGSWTQEGKLVTALPLDWTAAKIVVAPENAHPLAAGETLDRIYREKVAPTGVTREQFREANADLFRRAASLQPGTMVAIPRLSIENDKAQPFSGEVVLRTMRGTDEIIPASSLLSVQGESPHEIRFSYFMRFVIQSNGVYATDSSTKASVSNGARHVNAIDLVVERGGNRPEWAKKAELRGAFGPLVREAGDRVVFAAGTYGEHGSTAWKGWYQLNARGQIINEGWIDGMPDFAWGGLGKLDWTAGSKFSPEMPWELRLKLFVNGVAALRDNTDEGRALAERLNLPSNWHDYVTPRDRIPGQQ
jgi:hypothetical protein